MKQAWKAAKSFPGILGTSNDVRVEGATMSIESKFRRSRHKRKKRRKGGREAWESFLDSHPVLFEKRDLDPSDEELLMGATRNDDDIRRLAELKAEIYLDAGKAGLVVLLMLVVIAPLGFLGLIWWGIVHGRKLFRVMIEPGLRERLVEEEVSRHVQSNMGEERRNIADEHSRDLEVLSASIAHEIRNPITAAKSLLQQMSEDPAAVENPEYAQVALNELGRVEKSISHLLRFGRDEELRLTQIKMCDVLDSALETFRDRAERDVIEIRREFDCEGALMGDPEKLRRVVINLVGNAIDSLIEGEVEFPLIEISMGENLAGSEVWLRIRDNGPGIDADAQSKIFSPFYTAKQGGTGLGLAITKKLVDAHGGSIEVVPAAGQGAEFLLSFSKSDAPGNGSAGAGETR
jgi:signal transduction histidine kinase